MRQIEPTRTLIVSLMLFGAWATPGWAEPAEKKRVLLLGDAVMEAYRPEVSKILEGEAILTFARLPEGARPDWDSFFRTHVDNGKWDVIHFAYGRELMRHENSAPTVPADEAHGIYKGLLTRLQGAAPILIGCTVTPVNGVMPGSAEPVESDYPAKFKQSIAAAGLPVNDLADYTQTRLAEMVQPDSNLPTALGAQMMGEVVANSILEALNSNSTTSASQPRILVVGDSVVSGYYSALAKLFDGKAAVYKDGTTYNEPRPRWGKIVDRYLAAGGPDGWDVIQFNWGLHAVKYVDENNKNCIPDDPGARIQFTVEEYARQLELWVNELKRTNAKLIFATTTPVPEGARGSIPHIDVTPYNEAAKAIMAHHGITVNDLYAFAYPRLGELQIAKNVHFTPSGSKELARKTHEAITSLLGDGAHSPTGN
jgi:lysophospholipase L1-like esterase